jgi:hypothetical protein
VPGTAQCCRVQCVRQIWRRIGPSQPVPLRCGHLSARDPSQSFSLCSLPSVLFGLYFLLRLCCEPAVRPLCGRLLPISLVGVYQCCVLLVRPVLLYLLDRC